MANEMIPVPVKVSTATTNQAHLQSTTPLDTRIAQTRKQLEQKPAPLACADCQQELWISIFFDGTGNNYGADIKKQKQSNVARLFDSHIDEDISRGINRVYIEGLGTYNRDISDTGDGLVGITGNALANRGEDRIKLAFKKFDELVKAAAARATNPVNKIRMIHLALFGFSRGAALARAFAQRMRNKYCEPDGSGGWRTKDGHHPIEVYFMGLFDTVASVGAPPAAKNLMRNLRGTYNSTPGYMSPALSSTAMTLAAIDVFLSQADGHVAWGNDMRIPGDGFVKHCEHMVAAHEFRNSFPLELVMDKGYYPDNCRESVYPGAHSNVGGGYRPGEGGKSDTESNLLSQIPLREMHRIAIGKGVPLKKLSELDPDVLRGFAVDPALARRYDHYMKQAGFGGKPIDQMFLSHMKWYFRWRIIRVGRMLQAEKTGVQTDEEKKLAAYDAKITEETKRLEKERAQADHERERARQAYAAAVREVFGTEWLPTSVKHTKDAELVWKEKQDTYYRKNQELSQQPSVGKLAGKLRQYDKEFLVDSEQILRTSRDKLTRYQQMIYDAWKEPALTDAEIIAFFDNYVHDSHAGFALDSTHAIDPRILYQGGDDRVTLAQSGAGQQVA
jgi:serine/threonine protein kinase